MNKQIKNETNEEKTDREKAEVDIAKAKKEIKDIKLILDTNVLITASDGKKFQKEAIADIAGQNKTYICDTIFWEFLRNCSLDKFRARFGFLSNKKLLEVEHEDENVQRMYRAIWATYLCCYHDNPKKMSSIKIPDLWIVATATQRGIDNILTIDTEDFPDELFDKKSFYIGKDTSVILTTFNRDRAKAYMIDALNKGLLVSFQQFRNL